MTRFRLLSFAIVTTILSTHLYVCCCQTFNRADIAGTTAAITATDVAAETQTTAQVVCRHGSSVFDQWRTFSAAFYLFLQYTVKAFVLEVVVRCLNLVQRVITGSCLFLLAIGYVFPEAKWKTIVAINEIFYR